MEKKRFKGKKINTKEKTGVQKAAKGFKDTLGIGGIFVGGYVAVKNYGPQITKAIKAFKK